jgi:hypothetical protein
MINEPFTPKPATKKPATKTPPTKKPATKTPPTKKSATPATQTPATQTPFKPTPTLISNEKQTNNQIPIFVNPNNVPNEYATRKDVLENQNVSVQPKDMYYDIFDTNCVFSYNKPPECLIIKGNYVNKIPNKNCEKVCPSLYKKQITKENFTNFIDDNRQKYFWCYEKCGCVKHKYDPTDPSKNTCGDNGISQYPLDVYLSEAQCNKKSNPCEGLDEDECRNTSGCGYCRNNVGQGQCFSSTTEGPLNVKLPCIPDRMKPTNSFSLGRANPFEGVSQFLPEAMINNIKK